MCLLNCVELDQLYFCEDSHKLAEPYQYEDFTVPPVHYRELSDCMGFPVILDIAQMEVFVWHIEAYYKAHSTDNELMFIVGLYEYLTDVIGDL